MKTLLSTFVLSCIYSAVTLTQSILALGGILGVFIGLLPILAWFMLCPFYMFEEK